MLIDRSRGYYHLKTKRMYRITAFPLVRMNGPHDDKWVEGVEYRPMDSTSNETPHKDMSAVFVDTKASFKERMSVTNERVEMSTDLADLAEMLEGTQLSITFPAILHDVNAAINEQQTIKDVEAEIARLDTDGEMTAVLKDLWEAGLTLQNNRDIYDLGSLRSQPRRNRITMGVFERMARRLHWTRAAEKETNPERVFRSYAMIVTRSPAVMEKFNSLHTVVLAPKFAA